MAIANLPDDVLQQMFARESVADRFVPFRVHMPQQLVTSLLEETTLPRRCALACTCKRFRDLSLTAGFWENVELDVGRVQASHKLLIFSVPLLYSHTIRLRSKPFS